jgi:hypothetical protein
MNDGSISFAQAIFMNGGSVGDDQIAEESIFAGEVNDEALEAAAFGLMVTLILSVVLFACQFC